MDLLAAMRIARISAALIGLFLLLASIVSQVQVLIGGVGFIESQQGPVAIVGVGFVVASFIMGVVAKLHRD